MAIDDAGWEEAERALRRQYSGYKLHMLQRLMGQPPYAFDFWLSPDCRESQRIYQGRRVGGGGLAGLETYLRDIRFVDEPEYHEHIRLLLGEFGVGAPISPGFRFWTDEKQHTDLLPRVEAGEGVVRVISSFVDESPIATARREQRGRRVTTPDGPCDEFELPCPMERFTLVIRREGPLTWEKETFERTVSRSYLAPVPPRRWPRVVGLAVAASAIVVGIACVVLAVRR